MFKTLFEGSVDYNIPHEFEVDVLDHNKLAVLVSSTAAVSITVYAVVDEEEYPIFQQTSEDRSVFVVDNLEFFPAVKIRINNPYPQICSATVKVATL